MRYDPLLSCAQRGGPHSEDAEEVVPQGQARRLLHATGNAHTHEIHADKVGQENALDIHAEAEEGEVRQHWVCLEGHLGQGLTFSRPLS